MTDRHCPLGPRGRRAAAALWLLALLVGAAGCAPPAPPAATSAPAAKATEAPKPAPAATQAPAAAQPTAAPAKPAEAAKPAPTQAAAAAGARGGTLTIARPTDAVALDPHKETTTPGNLVMSNLYDTLVVLDTDLQFKPGLAERWEQPAPDRWRFHLRRGVKFHDGTDFKAQAVKFSIDRQKDPQNPGRSASNLVPIKAVEVVDDATVDVVTEGPYGPLLNLLGIVYMGGIVSPDAVQKSGEDFARTPVGTGPFKFVEWRTNNSITIERFDGYWGDKALLDRAVFRVIPEEGARMLALQAGEVDMAVAPAPSELPSLRRDNKFTIHEVPGVRVLYFGFNHKRPPLDDPKVRQAINFGVDRQAIVDNILEGAATLPTAYISPGVFGYKDTSANWGYDPNRAKQLLDEAGWAPGPDGIRAKDGKRLQLKHSTARGRYLKDAESGEAFQAAMKQIGVQVDIEVLEWGTLFGKIRQPGLDADLFTLGWSTATGDADYTLGPLYGCRNIPPAGWNSFEYCNQQFDELAVRGQRSTNQEERSGIYGQMLEILARDAVEVPIYNSKEIIATAAKVKGFAIHPIDYFLWLSKTSIEK